MKKVGACQLYRKRLRRIICKLCLNRGISNLNSYKQAEGEDSKSRETPGVGEMAGVPKNGCLGISRHGGDRTPRRGHFGGGQRKMIQFYCRRIQGIRVDDSLTRYEDSGLSTKGEIKAAKEKCFIRSRKGESKRPKQAKKKKTKLSTHNERMPTWARKLWEAIPNLLLSNASTGQALYGRGGKETLPKEQDSTTRSKMRNWKMMLCALETQ